METEKMEKMEKTQKSLSTSLTFKGFIVIALTLLLFIPNVMIQELIREREQRSKETIEKLNEKWSKSQTLCGPLLNIPFTSTVISGDNTPVVVEHELHLTPDQLDIKTQLFPEERHYGIYKAILYKSEVSISGRFLPVNTLTLPENSVFHFDKATISLGISDLHGLTSLFDFNLNGKAYAIEAAGYTEFTGKTLVADLNGNLSEKTTENLSFNCKLHLNGSGSMNFIPVGNTTQVEVAGQWKSPGFIGNFSPESEIGDQEFKANWSILSFNRSIPSSWVDNKLDKAGDASFGVNLVETVNHYQQTMRSAKYALMFIALTFLVFFFVEILAKLRIHPIQYALVGIALVLFYCLLLSISEHLGFTVSYLIASMAVVVMITAYSYNIFKNKRQTAAQSLLLCLLYIFLYVILQLEDVALLIGSIGLFVILGIVMYLSRKIQWYQ
ncbi:cell envelope integrity protein CreD [Bacteroidia bacterium]|nr:cell envelope integrity protein CreD [Bacteroidia bacterium]